MKPKHKRLVVVLASLACIFAGVFILLDTFRDNLIYFYPPKDIAAFQSTDKPRFEKLLRKQIRVGGMVKLGTYKKVGELGHEFEVTDYGSDLKIEYTGILPPMFREGQGVVAQGNLTANAEGYKFVAKKLLTKHDEKYMPPELKGVLGK